MNEHSGHHVSTVNSVSLTVGYDENGDLCHTPQVSKLVRYCYDCDELIEDDPVDE